ncbi:unnamed protein product [Caenorhabditis auriculariae]|uniref:CDC20/Fizzy WD40 domain-containing protein n=1 Tax=Caenorhabditis auriculariae TaxID=2777116 RepID=A0A8S1GQG4_9PELO|nr:unnamed protein product [Caenorhabditis auriculariae]
MAFRDVTNGFTPMSTAMRALDIGAGRSKGPGSAGRSTMAIGRKGGASQGLSLRKRDMTPTRNTNIVPNASMVGDRFLGVRMNEDEFDRANHLINHHMHGKKEDSLDTSHSAPNSPKKELTEGDRLKRMLRAKSSGNITDAKEDERILCYKKNLAPPPAVGYVNQAKVLYSVSGVINPASSVKKSIRNVSQTAIKVLDAPGLAKDLYSRHVDWGVHNWVAVAMTNDVYLWNTESGDIKNFFEDSPPMNEGAITGVKWSHDGKYLTLGYASGAVKIYDPNRPRTSTNVRELRTLRVGGGQRCAAMAWRKNGILTTGYKSGDIVNHDVRIHNHVVSAWGGEAGHSRDVTDLQWSADESMCASASADRTAKVWEERFVRSTDNSIIRNPSPLHTMDEHLGQVRCVQFCNFRDGILATGGGTGDGTVRLWDVKRNFQQLKEISICASGGVGGIVFNRAYSEMLTASDDGLLRICRFNASYKISHEIRASAEALMDCVASPNDEILTTDMEETLKVYRLFQVDKSTNILDRMQPRNVGFNVR